MHAIAHIPSRHIGQTVPAVKESPTIEVLPIISAPRSDTCSRFRYFFLVSPDKLTEPDFACGLLRLYIIQLNISKCENSQNS
jgi:hypothetical protein